MNGLRSAFDFEGIPVRLVFKKQIIPMSLSFVHWAFLCLGFAERFVFKSFYTKFLHCVFNRFACFLLTIKAWSLPKPQNPCFSCGPTAKHLGWDLRNWSNVLVGRAHRSDAVAEKLEHLSWNCGNRLRFQMSIG